MPCGHATNILCTSKNGSLISLEIGTSFVRLSSICMKLDQSAKYGSEKKNRIFCTKSPVILDPELPHSAKVQTIKKQLTEKSESQKSTKVERKIWSYSR